MAIFDGYDGITEYICTYCGRKEQLPRGAGRPAPGYCPRKSKDKNGNMKPHTWRINRKFKK